MVRFDPLTLFSADLSNCQELRYRGSRSGCISGQSNSLLVCALSMAVDLGSGAGGGSES